jgi:hypothetical protein
MQINITTFAKRREHYIHRTLQSLFASDWGDLDLPVNLMLGSDDDSHVRQYASHPSIRLVPWDMEAEAGGHSLRYNCTLNKIRALRYGDDGPTVICEDDVLFPPTWLTTLKAAAAELTGHDDYIMTLYAADHHIESARFVKGKSLVKRYPRYTLQGAQAIFYPNKSLRNKLADYLTKNIRAAAGDDLIGRYARSYSDLYVTTEALVENIGAFSVFHR